MRIFILFFIILISSLSSFSKDLSRALAEIAILTGSEEITEKAVIATHKALTDAFGVSFAAFDSPGVQEIIRLEKEWGGNPQASVWIDGTKLAAPDAAFVNSVLIHALDFDDIHIPAILHITSSVVPSAMAVGEEQGNTGREVIEAIVLGVEVAARLGREYQARKEHAGFLPSSIIGGFGAVAASSRLLGLSVKQTIDAYGIFYAHASGNRTALIDQALTKRIQPAIACRAGVVAAYLAKKGITGAQNIFLSDFGLFGIYGANKKPFPSVEDIRAERGIFEIELLSYKKFASCGGSHALLEATVELAKQHYLSLNDIDKIEIFIGKGTMVADPWDPSTGNLHVSAQFCAPYQVVSVIKNKRQGPAEITDTRITEDTEVSEMAEKVIIREPKEYREGDNRKQAIMITLKNGEVIENSQEVHERLFTPDYMTYQDIIEKFKDNVEFSGLVPENKAELLLKNIEALQDEKKIGNFINQHLKIKNKK
jgi:2-methylcitrate dehydratase PrpD